MLSCNGRVAVRRRIGWNNRQCSPYQVSDTQQAGAKPAIRTAIRGALRPLPRAITVGQMESWIALRIDCHN
jgi:hypothetical protein